MNKIRQLLKVKGNQVWTIAKDSTVLAGLELMAEKQIGALLVLDQGKLAGIFTERDFARKVGAKGRKPEDTLIAEVMTKELITVKPSQGVKECMVLMTEKRIRHLPVMEEDQVVGLISIGDVVKDLIEEMEFQVKQLQNYITGLR